MTEESIQLQFSRDALAGGPEGILVTDSAGRLVLASDVARALVGAPLAPDRPVDLDLRRTDGTKLSNDETPLARALLGERTTDCELVLRRSESVGVRVRVTARPLAGEDGAVRGAVVSIRETSSHCARHLAHDADASQTRYRLLAEYAYDWQYLTDQQGTLIFTTTRTPSPGRVFRATST